MDKRLYFTLPVLLVFVLIFVIHTKMFDKQDLKFQSTLKRECHALDQNAPEFAQFQSTKGNFTMQFFKEEMPCSVDFFLSLAHEGYYDNASFFKVKPGYVLEVSSEKDFENIDSLSFLDFEENKNLTMQKGYVVFIRALDERGVSRQFGIFLRDQYLPLNVIGKIVEGEDVLKLIDEDDEITSLRVY